MVHTVLDEKFPFPVPGKRAPGVHITDIIDDFMIDIGMKKYKSFGDMNEDELYRAKLRMEKGFIWEEALSIAMGTRLGARYEDITCEEVYLNPDGSHLDEGVIEEYKATKSSMKKFPHENLRWMMQVKAYCRATGCRIVIFRIYYQLGDYTGAKEEDYRAHKYEFSDQEIEENWTMLMNHAKMKGMI
jgi:hypothetical protein